MSALIVGCVFAVFGFTFLVLVKVYAILTLGKCHSTRKLHGKTAMVTGASRGIGYYTALSLAKRCCRVIITSENTSELHSARRRLLEESGARPEDIVAVELQLLDLAAVRRFAANINATENRLDILVNNAGTSGLGSRHTKDGILPGLQVNYFGPFLLTHLLLDLMKKTGNARIVNTASVIAHIPFGFSMDDISIVRTLPLDYEIAVYANSKILMAAFTMQLAAKLKGSGVTVNCLHPGIVYTQIFHDTKKSYVKIITDILGPLYFKTPAEGAETSIHLAVCENVEGITGKYFSDCRQSSLYGDYSRKAQEKIWEQSIRIVQLKPEEMCV